MLQKWQIRMYNPIAIAKGADRINEMRAIIKRNISIALSAFSEGIYLTDIWEFSSHERCRWKLHGLRGEGPYMECRIFHEIVFSSKQKQEIPTDYVLLVYKSLTTLMPAMAEEFNFVAIKFHPLLDAAKHKD